MGAKGASGAGARGAGIVEPNDEYGSGPVDASGGNGDAIVAAGPVDAARGDRAKGEATVATCAVELELAAIPPGRGSFQVVRRRTAL